MGNVQTVKIVVWLVCFSAAVAQADVFLFADGTRLEGTSEVDGDQVTISTFDGKTVKVAKKDIRGTVPEPNRNEYHARLKKTKSDDLAGQLELATFCDENKLPAEAEIRYQIILKLDPESVPVRKAWARKADAGDETAAKSLLDLARTSYSRAVEQFRAAVIQEIDTREAGARQQGDILAVEKIKVQREAFKTKKELPPKYSEAELRKMALAQDAMADSFDDAIARKTKGKKNEEAKALLKERDAFLAAESELVGDVLALFPDAYYKIVAVHSGKMLTTREVDANQGAIIIQATDDNSNEAMQWLLVRPKPSEPNSVLIKNKRSGLIIDITDASKWRGTVLHLWAATGGWN